MRLRLAPKLLRLRLWPPQRQFPTLRPHRRRPSLSLNFSPPQSRRRLHQHRLQRQLSLR